MGLFGKIKDILFDEEEIIEEKPERKSETVRVIERSEPVATEYKPPVVERPNRIEEPEPREVPRRTYSEPDNYKEESAFPFPDFDEDEFESVRPVQKPKSTNVLDYERNKRKDRKTEYGRIEKPESTEKKKFKPSPIISPVYGILNEDYVADDITNRGDPIPEKKTVTVESVRKKAFGNLDEPVKKEVQVEVETVRSYEPIEEKQQKVKTIDELLEDTSDVKISLDDEEIIEPIEEEKEEEPEEIMLEEKPEVNEEEDTLENDLFDLIDSMYDKGEDDE